MVFQILSLPEKPLETVPVLWSVTKFLSIETKYFQAVLWTGVFLGASMHKKHDFITEFTDLV